MQLNTIRTRLTNLLFVGIVTCTLFATFPFAAQAFFSSAPVDLEGYAWSSTIGWISLGNGGNEQVTINTDGTVTGYAWSENVGWLQFGGLSGFPASAAGTIPKNAELVDVGGGDYELQGWARFAAGNPAAGGWDGWVSLNGDTHSVQFNSTGPVADSYAWGSAVVGWIDMFSQVTLAPSSAATANLTATGCTVAAGDSSCAGSVSWNFSNANNPEVVRTVPGNDILSTDPSNSVDPYTMQLSTNTFVAQDDSGQLDTATVSIANGQIQCTANASPSGGVCACDSGFNDDDNNGTCEVDSGPGGDPTVNTFTITPPIVRKGQDVEVAWDVTDATDCTVTTSQGLTDTYTGSAIDSRTITINANNQVNVTLTCDGEELGQETVLVLPSIFES